MDQFFGVMGFPGSEPACGTGLRHTERTCCWRIRGALGCFKGAGGPHRTPALMAGFNAVPCASAPRRPGVETFMEQFFGDRGFPDAERACGTGLRHLPWPGFRHAERNFFVRQQRLFDTPAPQPVAGRRHLPKRCFGSGCARSVATLDYSAGRFDPGTGVEPARTVATRPVSILPPVRIAAARLPAWRARSCIRPANAAAPAPSAILWVSM